MKGIAALQHEESIRVCTCSMKTAVQHTQALQMHAGLLQLDEGLSAHHLHATLSCTLGHSPTVQHAHMHTHLVVLLLVLTSTPVNHMTVLQ
jgi:hypothetical protein